MASNTEETSKSDATCHPTAVRASTPRGTQRTGQAESANGTEPTSKPARRQMPLQKGTSLSLFSSHGPALSFLVTGRIQEGSSQPLSTELKMIQTTGGLSYRMSLSTRVTRPIVSTSLPSLVPAASLGHLHRGDCASTSRPSWRIFSMTCCFVPDTRLPVLGVRSMCSNRLCVRLRSSICRSRQKTRLPVLRDTVLSAINSREHSGCLPVRVPAQELAIQV